MCQMSMKLPVTFDQNNPHTYNKIVENKKTLSKLDLEPMVKVIAEIKR